MKYFIERIPLLKKNIYTGYHSQLIRRNRKQDPSTLSRQSHTKKTTSSGSGIQMTSNPVYLLDLGPGQNSTPSRARTLIPTTDHDPIRTSNPGDPYRVVTSVRSRTPVTPVDVLPGSLAQKVRPDLGSRHPRSDRDST